MLTFVKAILPALIALYIFSPLAFADEQAEQPTAKLSQEEQKKQLTNKTLATLLTFVEIQEQLRSEIKTLEKTLKSAQSDTEKKRFKGQTRGSRKEASRYNHKP